MALKLDRARNEAGVFEAHEVNGDDGPFECPECGIPVSHVTDHIRHGEDLRLRRHVPAYFRRHPRYEHGRCPYNVAGVIDDIFRDAKAVEDNLPFFDDESGSYRFRLNIVTAFAAHMRPLSAEDSLSRRISRAWASGKLDQYCRSAVGLASLWNMVESAADRHDLALKICFVERDRTLRWTDFCFAMNNYSRLLRHAQKKRDRHSVAAFVVVDSITAFAKGDGYILRCSSGLAGSNTKRVSPTIFATPSAFVGLEAGKQYLMFGDWNAGRVTSWSPDDDPSFKIEYHAVNLNLARAAQWAPIQVPGEGDVQEINR